MLERCRKVYCSVLSVRNINSNEFISYITGWYGIQKSAFFHKEVPYYFADELKSYFEVNLLVRRDFNLITVLIKK